MKTSSTQRTTGSVNQPSRAATTAVTEESRDIRETVSHDEIARRAHELWEQDGCPEGRSEQHWLEAEKQLRGSSFQQQQPDARDQASAIKASAERRSGGQGRG